MKYSLLITVFVAVISFKSHSQTPIDYETKSKAFFNQLATGTIEEAVKTLSLTEYEADSKATRLTNFKKEYGGYVGFEKIKEDKYGKSFVQLLYLAKYETQPAVFIFHVYHAKNTWQVVRLELIAMNNLGVPLNFDR